MSTGKAVPSVEDIFKMLLPFSMASIKTWLKSLQLPYTAGGKQAMAERVHKLFVGGSITEKDLHQALIGIEESGGKRVYIFQIDKTPSNLRRIDKALGELKVPISPRRLPSPRMPARTTRVYVINDDEQFRAKWVETHTIYRTDVDSLTVQPAKVTVIVVAVLNKKSGRLEIRYDRAGRRHPHGTGGKFSADAYLDYFREQTEVLLGQTFEPFEFRPALDKLLNKHPRIVEVESNDALNDEGMVVKITSRRRGRDVRDGKDYTAINSHGAKIRTQEGEAVFWLVAPSGGKLQREVYTVIDGKKGFVRFEADCLEGEINYALSHLA